MVINTNTTAQNAATLLQQSSANLSASLARLSSGSKITSPADDSAGLAVSMKLGAQIARVGAAQNNVNNAISFNQTQDGYLQKVNDALTRMSELTVSAQDVTKTTSDRALYQQEFGTLQTYVKDVSTKDFNGVSLFDGATLHVTTDSDGNKFDNGGVNLNCRHHLCDRHGEHHESGLPYRCGVRVGGRQECHQHARLGSRDDWCQRGIPGLL